MVALKNNLKLNGKSIRTLEELQENFNIDDILENLESGRLIGWVKDKLPEHLERIENIKGDNLSRAIELCDIFDISIDESELERLVLMYSEKKEQQAPTATLNGQTKDDIINEYFDGCRTLIEDIVKHKDDYEYLKIQVLKLFTKYSAFINLNNYLTHKEKSVFDVVSRYITVTETQKNIMEYGIIGAIIRELDDNDDIKFESEYYNLEELSDLLNPLLAFLAIKAPLALLVGLSCGQISLELDDKILSQVFRRIIKDVSFDEISANEHPYLKTFDDCGCYKDIILILIDKGNSISIGNKTLYDKDINGKFLRFSANEICCPADIRLLCTQVW